MARLTSKQMADIVARDMPGFRLAKPTEVAGVGAPTTEVADAATPDLDALRRKYFGDAPEGAMADAGVPVGDQKQPTDDDEIVHVVPKDAGDPWDRARRPKAVVFSHREGRVVGYQG